MLTKIFIYRYKEIHLLRENLNINFMSTHQINKIKLYKNTHSNHNPIKYIIKLYIYVQ